MSIENEKELRESLEEYSKEELIDLFIKLKEINIILCKNMNDMNSELDQFYSNMSEQEFYNRFIENLPD